MFQTNFFLEKFETQIFSFHNLFFENLAAYQITWKDTVQPGRPSDDNMAHAHLKLDT